MLYKNNYLFWTVLIICSILFFISLYNAISCTYENGYRAACKDFYQGKLKYSLQEKEDGSIKWIKNN